LSKVFIKKARNLCKYLLGLWRKRREKILGVRHAFEDLQICLDSGTPQQLRRTFEGAGELPAQAFEPRSAQSCEHRGVALAQQQCCGAGDSRRDRAGHELVPDGRPSAVALTPRLDESAGKRRSTRVKKGAPWLKPVLVQCAFAAARTKNTYLQAQFLRIKARRGPKKAAIAVAASILTAAYHMLRDGTFYNDLGPTHFARRDKTRAAMRLVRRIKELGYDVEIKAAA
jgi:hypothetical protein